MPAFTATDLAYLMQMVTEGKSNEEIYKRLPWYDADHVRSTISRLMARHNAQRPMRGKNGGNGWVDMMPAFLPTADDKKMAKLYAGRRYEDVTVKPKASTRRLGPVAPAAIA